MIYILIIPFLLISAFADCRLPKNNEVIERSKHIFLAELKYAKEPIPCKNFEFRTVNYDVEVKEVLGGNASPGNYKLQIKGHCNRKPPVYFFGDKETAILAVERIEKGNLFLVGEGCEYWGWKISQEKSLRGKLKEYCEKNVREIFRSIEKSRECKVHDDCTYISFMAEKTQSCHHFVNRSNRLEEKIMIFKSSVCGTNSWWNCKAPIESMIGCNKGKCSFPVQR